MIHISVIKLDSSHMYSVSRQLVQRTEGMVITSRSPAILSASSPESQPTGWGRKGRAPTLAESSLAGNIVSWFYIHGKRFFFFPFSLFFSYLHFGKSFVPFKYHISLFPY